MPRPHGKGSVLETLARQRLSADREREARSRAREEARERREAFVVQLDFAGTGERARRAWTHAQVERDATELVHARARINAGEPDWADGGSKSWDDPGGPIVLQVTVKPGREDEAELWLADLHLPPEEAPDADD